MFSKILVKDAEECLDSNVMITLVFLCYHISPLLQCHTEHGTNFTMVSMVLISWPLSPTDCFPSGCFSSHPLSGNFTQYQVSQYSISWFLCQFHNAQTSLFYVK